MAQGKRSANGSAKRTAAGKTKQKTPKTWKTRLRSVLRWGLVCFLVLSLIGVGVFIYAYRSIDIPNANAEFLTETTHVYYADGETDLGQFAIQRRDAIDYDEMPQSIKDAVVASENRTFWTDKGIDPRGIVRAAFSNAKGGSTQGASTITQQYVKILYLTQDRTWTRKIKEAFLSLKVQNQLSKEDVLEGYLNTIYFGRGAYGIQAASQAYFDKDAADLSLRESAFLASVLNNPYYLDPANGKESRQAVRARYEYTLGGMLEMETISQQQYDRAVKRLPKFPKIASNSQYGGQKGHVLSMVRSELLELGFSEDEINGGGLRVTTTFTPQAMKAAEQGVLDVRPEGFSDKELHVGVASVEPGTGAVRGLYGGQDYLDSQINWAVAGGQAGSTFKAFAVAAGIKAGFSLKDTFDGNSPYELPDGKFVENQGDHDYGRVNLITATERSANTAFIDMTLSMGSQGPEEIVEMANAMGVPPIEPASDPYGFPTSSPGLNANTGVSLGSQTVSPINMANGYATIANKGVAADAYIIDKVVDRDGVIRYQHKVSTHRAMSEDIAADVSYALQQVVEGSNGTGRRALALGRPAGGKTGTATVTGGDVSSAWFAGFTPQMSTAVMYVRGDGNDKLDGWLPSYYGGDFPTETWVAVMAATLEGEPIEDLPEPVYVDGEAPTDGHEPAPTRTPKPKPSQAEEPTQGPSTSKAPEPTTSAPPTTEAPEPSDTPTPEESTAPTGPATTQPPATTAPTSSAPPTATIPPPPGQTRGAGRVNGATATR
ncbi:transglycosylase domain-containing protein [Nocardioides sp. GY 10113]|uniref:transglycosylase domain-containing protein n=1 Tax=Nocardioides sp. GY 10113 TaxID=2569761 RepID=UPI001F10D8AE|nr:transglycosylase domain-containing protein [Nocardioides sp. GY 10113]